MTTSSSIHYPIKPLLAGGLMFALIGILLDINGVKTLLSGPFRLSNTASQNPSISRLAQECETEIVDSAQLSREQLLKLLAIPERDSKERVRQVVQSPYCQLSSLDIRAGVKAEREAYPLAFDPETTLVILYENDEYAGYRFKL
ncbi:hypothetical protein [Leptolyngbya sp. BC1307]|uniref:hypothetical protein n=1 Tax=Leptolyngbya sp. BC1307 TaxID=2029589 RepID=UPI000EFD16E3|nr:hypothetical protein [Leptolyngbya sp. BC1307]